MKDIWAWIYLSAMAALVWGGLCALFVLGLPILMGLSMKTFLVGIVISSLVPILIVGIYPEKKKYKAK